MVRLDGSAEREGGRKRCPGGMDECPPFGGWRLSRRQSVVKESRGSGGVSAL